MKNIINKILLSLYILSVLAIPMSVLAMAVAKNIVPFSESNWMNAGRLAYYFISIPAYFVYAKMMIREYFPKENKKTLTLFVPLIVTLGLYFFNKPDNLLELLILDSLPMYLGLNLLFFLGLAQILIFEEFSFIRLFVSILILGFLFYGAICVFIIGYQLNIKYSITATNEKVAILKYIFSILLVSFFHLSLFQEMSKNGKF